MFLLRLLMCHEVFHCQEILSYIHPHVTPTLFLTYDAQRTCTSPYNCTMCMIRDFTFSLRC